MPTYEGLRMRILKIFRIGLSKIRNKQVNNKDFTIISNNCWGGIIYESYNLPKNSPTVGLYMMAEDYINFVSDLKNYINAPLNFISPDQSKWKNAKPDPKFGAYPIGVLDNGKDKVEIMFLHYKDNQEALDKWNRRCSRINWDNLIIKFDDQNRCNIQHVERFVKLPYRKKIFFTSNRWKGLNIKDNNTYAFYIRQEVKSQFVTTSHEPFGRKITKIIND